MSEGQDIDIKFMDHDSPEEDLIGDLSELPGVIPTESFPVYTAYELLTHANPEDLDDLGIVVDKRVLDRMKKDLEDRGTHREAGGMIIGHPAKDNQGGLFVKIVDYVPNIDTPSSAVQTYFTPEAWGRAKQYIDSHYPNTPNTIIGTAHSHPGLGVFLSQTSTDGSGLAINDGAVNAYFKEPYHLAVVYDTVRKELGVFSRGGRARSIDVNGAPVDFEHGFKRHNGIFVEKPPEIVI